MQLENRWLNIFNLIGYLIYDCSNINFNHFLALEMNWETLYNLNMKGKMMQIKEKLFKQIKYGLPEMMDYEFPSIEFFMIAFPCQE